ncbi:MAG TPA: penicillin-binding protein activator, partial [Methylocella sp.]|nr:penicillin-binding protein activator [Methylocella sp.]
MTGYARGNFDKRGEGLPSRPPFCASAMRAALIAALCLALAACNITGGIFGRPGSGGVTASAPQGETAPQNDLSEKIGSGQARVALILPLTQAAGGASVVGTSLRNAGELAWIDAGNNEITLLVKDDHSTPEGARAAAQAAVADGAEIILG